MVTYKCKQINLPTHKHKKKTTNEKLLTQPSQQNLMPTQGNNIFSPLEKQKSPSIRLCEPEEREDHVEGRRTVIR